MTAEIRHLDHVYWGNVTAQSVHWRVLEIDKQAETATLVSGQTNRIAYGVPLERLTLHPSSLNERSIA